jgi:hypothetical protein
MRERAGLFLVWPSVRRIDGPLEGLEVIWDRCGTAERQREFAELLFSHVTVDQFSRTRAWALSNPFSGLLISPSPVRNLFWMATPSGLGGANTTRPPQIRLTPLQCSNQQLALGVFILRFVRRIATEALTTQ